MDRLDEIDLTDDEDFLEIIREVNDGLHRNPRIVRNRDDQFEKWSDEEFFNRFRLTKPTVRLILVEIRDVIASPTQRNDAVSVADKLLLTLRFFACGSMLITVGDFFNIHKSTASRIVHKVSIALAQLRPNYIQFPNTNEMLNEVRGGFYRIARFPKCIGAIDCTHVKIQSPGGDNAEIYRNRKGYFSMNVQCVCDSSLKITNIVCRWPGTSHDSTIFNMSSLRARFENGEFNDHLLVGDSGYGIRHFLITPLRNPVTPAEHLFNEAQIRTRNPIERCFGVWKRRFPILALGIRLKREIIEPVIVATAVLHNIACNNQENQPPVDDYIGNLVREMEGADEFINVNNNAQPNNTTRQGLINYFAGLL